MGYSLKSVLFNYCHALHAKDADNLPRLWAIKTRYYFLGSHVNSEVCTCTDTG